MSAVSAAIAPTTPRGETALRRAARFWFLATVAGQWLFAVYLLVAYAAPVAIGDPAALNETGPITGYVEGDLVGNLFLLAHVLLAIVISFGGALQLVPQLRARAPAFHRWNGRIFLTIGLIGAVSGLWLTWGRGSRLSDVGALSVTLNGILIIGVAAQAWRTAMQRRFTEHRRWAVRTFLLVSGVWTFRLGLMGWLMLNQGLKGNTAKLDGPMDLAIGFGSYLLPLAIAELFFLAERRGNSGLRRVTAAVLTAATLAMCFGIFAAWMMLWRPHF
ncbi:MAG: DUF2306 domain-containing protein [Pseudomonadota bacterium]